MIGGEGVFDKLKHRRDKGLRKRAVGPPRPVRIEPARQEIEADEELLLGGEVARPVQRVLVALRLRHVGFGARARRPPR